MASVLQRQLKAARKHLDVLATSPGLQSPVIYMEQRRKSMQHLAHRLAAAQDRVIYYQKQRFISNTAKLDAMSPLKVLTRGYAMAQTEGREVVRSIKQVAPGDILRITVSDGSLQATVLETKENSYESK